MGLEFEWDEKKAVANQNKHGVAFEEGKTVFNDPYAITIADPGYSIEEDRWVDIGLSGQGRVLVVWYTEVEQRIRIIGCRKATTSETQTYVHGRN